MSHRIDRVNELLKREIGAVVQKDYEWNGALVTVNAVEPTRDIRKAKAVGGGLGGWLDSVREKLSRDQEAFQTTISKRVVLKSMPVITFRHDNSAERGVEIVNLLDEVAKLPTAKDGDEREN